MTKDVEEKNAKNLMGNQVVHCEVLKDESGEPGYFFVFTDLCCRWTGTFILRFIVNDISGPKRRAMVFSEPFTVYTPRKFPGILEATELSLAFYKQGVNLNIRRRKHLTSDTETFS